MSLAQPSHRQLRSNSPLWLGPCKSFQDIGISRCRLHPATRATPVYAFPFHRSLHRDCQDRNTCTIQSVIKAQPLSSHICFVTKGWVFAAANTHPLVTKQMCDDRGCALMTDCIVQVFLSWQSRCSERWNGNAYTGVARVAGCKRHLEIPMSWKLLQGPSQRGLLLLSCLCDGCASDTEWQSVLSVAANQWSACPPVHMGTTCGRRFVVGDLVATR